MKNLHLVYKIKSANKLNILKHLIQCDKNFTPPLSQKVNLQQYSSKIFLKAITFEAWAGEVLVGLVAAYFNDAEHIAGYITNVSIMNGYSGMGIASSLIKECLTYAQNKAYKIIKLEVNNANAAAISLYEKFDFVKTEQNDNQLFMERKI